MTFWTQGLKLSRVLAQIVWRRSSFIIGMVACCVAIGYFAQLSYQQFIFLQAQNISRLSVFNEVVVPLAGLTLLCQLVVMIIVSTLLLPTLKNFQQYSLLLQASVTPAAKLFAVICPIIVTGILPLSYFCAVVTLLLQLSDLDWYRLMVLILGMLVVCLVSSFLIFAICALVRRVLTAILLTVVLLSLLLIVETSVWFWYPQIAWPGIFNSFFHFREGLVVYAELVAYLGWLLIFSALSGVVIQWRNQSSRTSSMTLLSSGTLILAAAFFIPGQTDFTLNQRNTFSDNLAAQLREFDQPLQVTAVVNAETGRDEIKLGFDSLQRIYPTSELKFHTQQSARINEPVAGEYLRFQLGELHQLVSYPFERPAKQVFESAIAQMLTRKSQWITFVEGHGEASPFGQSTADLKNFYQNLVETGWPVAVVNLAKTPMISDNTRLLIIAASKHQWLASETKLVIEYLERGGNLLLMLDPESYYPATLQSYLGITRFDGTLVDWQGYQGGTPHPAIVIVNQLSDHPVVSQLDSLLAFPWTSGLQKIPTPAEQQRAKSRFELASVVSSHSGVWNELAIEQEQLAFSAELGEQQQSFDIALALTDSSHQQKIIVVGDSHFASDSAINNYANKQFALNLVSWLTNVEMTEITAAELADNSIAPSLMGRFLFSWGFNILFPLFLLIWWVMQAKRRARHGN